MKTLIGYYSRGGKNYVGGNIVNLRVGNTKVAAAMIQKLVGGALFRIETLKAYPADYDETTEVAKRELRERARPELLGRLENLEEYERIFLGYPNWWGTMPMAVYSFLEAYDFSGKTIFPFCTHEGSGMGRSEAEIQKACPVAIVRKGIAIQGGRVSEAEKDIAAWLGRSAVPR